VVQDVIIQDKTLFSEGLTVRQRDRQTDRHTKINIASKILAVEGLVHV
jgi:hypothetical protein